MPIAHTQLFFNQPLNVSIQKGDMIYYVNTVSPMPSASTGTQFNLSSGSIREIGKVIDIFQETNSLVCEFNCTGVGCNDHIPSDVSFIMFSKDNAANMSSILGHYAEVEMVNNSNEKAKLFAVSTDISESSK